jgi:xanthine dehydrogenase accessory factor
MRIWGHIANCLKSSGACALVTVAETGGSTPRETGARMIVRPDGGFYGTIGGGTLEFEVIRQAAKAAGSKTAGFELTTVSLGPDLGQCCGGRAKIAIEVFVVEHLETAEQLALEEGKPYPFVTRAIIENDSIREREIVDQVPESAFEIADVNGKEFLIEQFGETRRTLYLFGAGHVGKALVLALAPLPFSIVWIDSRADQFPSAVPANVTKVCTSDPAKELEDAPDGAFVLAMTHSHGLDEEIMARALLAQRFDYCGVIGSKTKRVRFLKRLKTRGLSDSVLSTMVCPVGVTTIKLKHPAAIAAGIVVDLIVRDEACYQQAAASGRLAHK